MSRYPVYAACRKVCPWLLSTIGALLACSVPAWAAPPEPGPALAIERLKDRKSVV